MSWNPALDPHCPTGDQVDLIETLIVPRARDIFFDQMGPVEFITGKGIDVRPHPHIGLATVTYLFDGAIHHRDSLGTSQQIEEGAVNWMIAGRGITHSERTATDLRAQDGNPLFGIQTWVALPEKDEETDPGFEHHAKETLPFIEAEGKSVRLILGSLYGEKAPVKTFSDMFYGDAILAAGSKLPLPSDHEDRAIYVVEGEIEVAGDRFDAGRMMVFRPGDEITVTALRPTRLILLGGDTLGGPRHIWWNFVASSPEKIEAAKEAWREGDWQDGRFHLPPDDDSEFIPLPGR